MFRKLSERPERKKRGDQTEDGKSYHYFSSLNFEMVKKQHLWLFNKVVKSQRQDGYDWAMRLCFNVEKRF